jgi:gamma-glutamyl:cysteine ligase YbdK (ATP-grasp superfamily)
MLSVIDCKRLLNRLLKEATHNYVPTVTTTASKGHTFEDEIRALLDEINSLWDEVVPVAHMAVEKTMLEPILKLVEAKEQSQKHQNAIIGSYVTCFSFPIRYTN